LVLLLSVVLFIMFSNTFRL